MSLPQSHKNCMRYVNFHSLKKNEFEFKNLLKFLFYSLFKIEPKEFNSTEKICWFSPDNQTQFAVQVLMQTFVMPIIIMFICTCIICQKISKQKQKSCQCFIANYFIEYYLYCFQFPVNSWIFHF